MQKCDTQYTNKHKMYYFINIRLYLMQRAYLKTYTRSFITPDNNQISPQLCSNSGSVSCAQDVTFALLLTCLSQYSTNLMHKICFTISFISCLYMFRAHVPVIRDCLCGLVVRVSGYRYRGPGFDPRRYQIF